MKADNIWLASDHHLGHHNILKFTRADGSPLRQFSCIEEHDEHIINQHNSVVKHNDIVYFLGDLTFRNQNLKLIKRMNGAKRLLTGNHDIWRAKHYLNAGFVNVSGIKIFTPKETGRDNVFCVASHVPVHPSSLYRWAGNVHGHTHSNIVNLDDGSPDLRYISVSMEQLPDYTPLSLSQVTQQFMDRGIYSRKEQIT